MSQPITVPEVNRASGAAMGYILVAGIFVVLAVIVELVVNPPSIDADQAEQRTKALNEMLMTENVALTSPGWIDQSHGIVRLPIDTAIQQAAEAWQNPAQARADLINRAEKASAPLPKAPEKPSAFE